MGVTSVHPTPTSCQGHSLAVPRLKRGLTAVNEPFKHSSGKYKPMEWNESQTGNFVYILGIYSLMLFNRR